MFSTAIDSAKLFFAGKLFQNNSLVFRQLALGVLLGAISMVGVSFFAPIWLAAIAGGFVSGFLQPILFKDLKYA